MMYRSRIWWSVTVLVVLCLSASGCAFDPSSVPVPGTTVSGPTYKVHIEFASALNLPARAKVVANGARVGTVSHVSIVDPASSGGRGGYVQVDADISKSVHLPTTTVAELRQDTVLGDIHIALTTPPDGFGSLLAPGGTLPLNQTRPPTQIEDTMAGMATFVQGGAINQLTDIVHRLNTVLPADRAETARISQVLGADAIDLSRNLDQVDVFLNGFTSVSGATKQNADTLQTLLTEKGVDQVSGAVGSVVGVVGVLGALGGVAHSLTWLTPLAQSGDAAARAFVPLALTGRPLDLDAPSNLNALVALIRDKIIPFAQQGPKVDIVGATVDGGSKSVSKDDQANRILQTLRMIGAVR